MRSALCAGFVPAPLTRSALAGPPYVSDDPEPTDYRHFEIYTFNNGTATRGGTAGESGIDFNYGAAPDLQLTATLPTGFDRPAGVVTSVGLSNIELAAKFRFLHQRYLRTGCQRVPAHFPAQRFEQPWRRVVVAAVVQKDWSGGWSAFGGGGCTVSEFRAVDFCQAGAVLTYQVQPKLQIGAELFHQTAESNGTPATTSLGIGWRYDARLCQAGYREHQRDRSIFLVRLSAVYILNRRDRA